MHLESPGKPTRDLTSLGSHAPNVSQDQAHQGEVQHLMLIRATSKPDLAVQQDLRLMAQGPSAPVHGSRVRCSHIHSVMLLEGTGGCALWQNALSHITA